MEFSPWPKTGVNHYSLLKIENNMYIGITHLHNLLRWLILLAALFVIFRAWTGLFGKKSWTKTDNLAGIIFTSLFDLQVLTGLALYFFLSPITQIAFIDFGTVMQNAETRFWSVEHLTLMLVALVLVHVGRFRAKKAGDPVRKHRILAIFYTLALLLILAGIPWNRGF